MNNITKLNRIQYMYLYRMTRCSKNLSSTNKFKHLINAFSEAYDFLEQAELDFNFVREERNLNRELKREPKLTERQQRIALLRGKCTGKVYYINSGRDCDGVEYSSSYDFDNQYEADVYIESAYEWADGPMYWSKCTKEEYDEHKSYQRDTYAEAAGY